jgi:palmitoyltransferase
MGYGILSILNIVLFNSFVLMAIFSHIKTMCTDPGAVPKKSLPLLEDQQEVDHEASMKQMNGLEKYKKMCKRCRHFKPIRAHHCSMCNRCVVKMDHHCPWVNNCVGIGNHKLFVVFLFWVNVTCLYSLLLVAGRVTSCWYQNDPNSSCTDVNINFGIIFLFAEATLFVLFTTCMLADQFSSIMTNQTQIDRLKGERHNVGIEVNEVFGTPLDTRFQYSWLFPSPVQFPPNIRDKIYGYRLQIREAVTDSSDEETDVLISTTVVTETRVAEVTELASDSSHTESGDEEPDIERGGSASGQDVSPRYERVDSNLNIRKRVSPPL